MHIQQKTAVMNFYVFYTYLIYPFKTVEAGV